jgi:nicotinate-nucleotide adenylyltransferase
MYELAIYGGTFAPVHNGHVRAANAFFEAVRPDKLLLIPTLIPPHKQLDFKDDPKDRLNMLHLAFEDHPFYNKKIFVSDYELSAPPPSYTVNTLRHFTASDTRITFLVGTDMFLTLDRWYLSEEIFHLSRIALMKRESESADISEALSKQEILLKEKFNADIVFVSAPPIEVSSSEIRQGNDKFKQKYLPSKVYKYIKEHSLYEDQ